MFNKKMLLGVLSAICLSLAIPSVAIAMDKIAVNKIESVQFTLKEQPTHISLASFEAINLSASEFVHSPNIEIFDYGGNTSKQANLNKLADNFAKVQNQNFERMLLTVSM